jgi:arginyl-tRNA synthetase
MIRILSELVKKALASLDAEGVSFSVEAVKSEGFWDYSTNCALILGKQKGESPIETAKKIVSEIEKEKPKEIEKIEIAGPGFINFYVSREFIIENTKHINSQKENYGKNTALSGKRVLVEYTDPNPFKEFHIGHLMSNAIGESISRLIEFSGAEVKRACYQGDVGMHVAKWIWGIIEAPNSPTSAYMRGHGAYLADENAKKEINEINKKIYERSDEKINKLYDDGKKASLESFGKIYKRLGTKFDENFYFFESESGPVGIEIVKKNFGKVFEESEGAIVYKGERAGLHTRVFITKENLPTYEAKELGLAELKEKKYKSDIPIVVTGNEVKDYFNVVRGAMKEIPELSLFEKKLVHIPHGMLRLPSGKMSSRTGDVITAESLLSDIEKSLREKFDNKDEKTIEQVAVSAIKYSVLKQETGKDIIFDFEKSISFTGNSGPYLQYTFARCQSLLSKGRKDGVLPASNNLSQTTKNIERILIHFPEVVERAGKEYAPHYVATYLHLLSSAFNAFYGGTPIVKKDDLESSYKLFVTEAVGNVLKNGLYLLGIGAPDKM